jgi:alcohol dehydrogenase class IV
MPNSGRVVLSRMDEVVYGKPAAESVAELARRYQAERVFLMVSGTLNRETDEIDRLRRALGNHCVGTFDKMPPHTPRAAVIAAAEQARAARADLIVTLGGGSITDGAKPSSLCLANDIRKRRGARPDPHRQGRAAADQPTQGPADRSPPPCRPASSRHPGVTDERAQGEELFRHPDIIPKAVVLDPAVTRHTPMWLFLSTGIRAVDHCVEGICSNEIESLRRRLGAARPGAAGARPAAGQGRSGRHGSAARLPDRRVAVDGAAGRRRADGRQHGIGYVLGAVFDIPHGHTSCIAALGDALEQIANGPRSHGRQRHGPSQGCRRRARSVHPRARHAAKPWA